MYHFVKTDNILRTNYACAVSTFAPPRPSAQGSRSWKDVRTARTVRPSSPAISSGTRPRSSWSAPFSLCRRSTLSPSMFAGRRSSVSAVADYFENVGEYVNEKCAASLPPGEYLPAVHAILILAPHYIWLNLLSWILSSTWCLG